MCPSVCLAGYSESEAGDPEERENAQTRQSQIAFVVPVPVKHREAFLVPVGQLGGAAAYQEWSESHRDAGQRWVLGLVSIDAQVEPLHAAANVARFVHGVVEDGVSSGNTQRGESEQADEDKRAMLLDPRGGSQAGLRRRRVLRAAMLLRQFLLYNHRGSRKRELG